MALRPQDLDPDHTEPRAEARALDRMKEFLGFLTKTYYPEFNTYPVLVKMGLLDLAYQRGARGARDFYPVRPRFAAPGLAGPRAPAAPGRGHVL